MNRVTGVSPAVAAHKKLILSRVTMADGRNHSGSKRTFLERPPDECPPHPTTAPPCSVCRDRSRFLRRTPWEQSRDRTGHMHDEIAIIFGTAHFVPFALSRAAHHLQGILVRRARARPPKPRCPGVRSGHVTY